MFFRSNVARKFDVVGAVHSPVDNPVASAQVNHGVDPEFPQAIHRPDEGDLLWLNGYEEPVDREEYVEELNAERHGLARKGRRQ